MQRTVTTGSRSASSPTSAVLRPVCELCLGVPPTGSAMGRGAEAPLSEPRSDRVSALRVQCLTRQKRARGLCEPLSIRTTNIRQGQRCRGNTRRSLPARGRSLAQGRFARATRFSLAPPGYWLQDQSLRRNFPDVETCDRPEAGHWSRCKHFRNLIADAGRPGGAGPRPAAARLVIRWRYPHGILSDQQRYAHSPVFTLAPGNSARTRHVVCGWAPTRVQRVRQ